ncbi:hypothetical protein GCM10010250_65530 [Streptomyces althioticus]|nr:hypothetical protein GCM10010250_65530 [Streptomyces althioticus]
MATADANIRTPPGSQGPACRCCCRARVVAARYLVRLVQTLLTPGERAERAEKARAVLQAWNGYAPTPSEGRDLDRELERRLARATSR